MTEFIFLWFEKCHQSHIKKCPFKWTDFKRGQLSGLLKGCPQPYHLLSCHHKSTGQRADNQLGPSINCKPSLKILYNVILKENKRSTRQKRVHVRAKYTQMWFESIMSSGSFLPSLVYLTNQKPGRHNNSEGTCAAEIQPSWVQFLHPVMLKKVIDKFFLNHLNNFDNQMYWTTDTSTPSV